MLLSEKHTAHIYQNAAKWASGCFLIVRFKPLFTPKERRTNKCAVSRLGSLCFYLSLEESFNPNARDKFSSSLICLMASLGALCMIYDQLYLFSWGRTWRLMSITAAVDCAPVLTMSCCFRHGSATITFPFPVCTNTRAEVCQGSSVLPSCEDV